MSNRKYVPPEGRTHQKILAKVKGCCRVVRVDDGQVFSRHPEDPDVWLLAVYTA